MPSRSEAETQARRAIMRGAPRHAASDARLADAAQGHEGDRTPRRSADGGRNGADPACLCGRAAVAARIWCSAGRDRGGRRAAGGDGTAPEPSRRASRTTDAAAVQGPLGGEAEPASARRCSRSSRRGHSPISATSSRWSASGATSSSRISSKRWCGRSASSRARSRLRSKPGAPPGLPVNLRASSRPGRACAGWCWWRATGGEQAARRSRPATGANAVPRGARASRRAGDPGKRFPGAEIVDVRDRERRATAR